MKCYGLNCLFVPAAASECFEKSDPVKNASGSRTGSATLVL